MDCHTQETHELLSAYFDGELDAGQRDEVERHLAGCATCRRALAEMRSLDTLLAGAPRMRASDGFAAGLRARMEAEPVAPRQWRWWVLPLAAAATVLIVIGGSLLLPASVAPDPTTVAARQQINLDLLSDEEFLGVAAAGRAAFLPLVEPVTLPRVELATSKTAPATAEVMNLDLLSDPGFLGTSQPGFSLPGFDDVVLPSMTPSTDKGDVG